MNADEVFNPRLNIDTKFEKFQTTFLKELDTAVTALKLAHSKPNNCLMIVRQHSHRSGKWGTWQVESGRM